MAKTFFFDSYAIIEIIKGNEAYAKYTRSTIITTHLNLFELYYFLLKENKTHMAKELLEKYSRHVIELDNDTVIYAATMKSGYKKKKLSMSDCIGYALAKKLGIRFLTGDSQFSDLANVEFVK